MTIEEQSPNPATTALELATLPKSGRTARKHRGAATATNLAKKTLPKRKTKARPKRRVKAARPGTKTAKVIALLERPTGATLPQLMKATSWQAHSVRGFLAGLLAKKMGLKIVSSKPADGDRVYSIRG